MQIARDLIADARHALRLYIRTPGGTLIAVVGLGIAMATVTAFMSLYVDLVLRPHAGFERAGALVTFGWNDGRNAGGLPLDLINRIEREALTLQAAGTEVATYEIGSDREQHIAEAVSAAFFSALRPRLALGRGFERADHQPDAEPVAVISWRYWQQQFGARPDVLGETVEVRVPPQGAAAAAAQGNAQGDTPATSFRIVGVMAREYVGTVPPGQASGTALWMPVEPVMAARGQSQATPGPVLRTIGRRAPGATAQAVAAELNGRFGDVLRDYVNFDNVRFYAMDGLVFSLHMQRSTLQQLQLFLAGGALLTIVAAANIGLFLLARAPGRRRELAIRLAVGAPLRRLIRQLVTEAFVLVAAGAALGLLLSVWLAGFLRDLSFLRGAQWRDVTVLDWRVLASIGVLLLLMTALVSAAPILGLKKAGIAASSRLVTARATVAQRIAGSAQIAVAGTLGAAALAFTWHLGSLMLADPGYETRGLKAVSFSNPPAATFSFENAVVDQARRREAIESLPGVDTVSVAGMVPGAVFPLSVTLPRADDPSDLIRLTGAAIDHHYFDLLGLRLLYGRAPLASDTSVMLVNQSLARRMWGRDNVVGEQLPISVDGSEGSQIIGVMQDLSFRHPHEDVEALAFISPGPIFSGVALVRGSLTTAELRQAVQGLVDSGRMEISILDVAALDTLRHNMLAADRARGFLTIFAAIGVVALAAFGFYGTQKYVVTAGRREYAIRASLGAGPRALGRQVQWQALRLGLPGIAMALPLAMIVVASLRDDFLSDAVSPLFVTVIVAISMCALLAIASVGPARQAQRTQPAPLLRED
jgi:ABC-type antimicrobial peptide transport system permease subunit